MNIKRQTKIIRIISDYDEVNRSYVADLVDGLLRAGFYKEAVGQEFNLASGKETKIIDLANMINGLAGNKAGIKFISIRVFSLKKLKKKKYRGIEKHVC